MKLWGGRFEEGPSEVFERFSGSLDFDQRLIHADIQGSQAFARALESVGILTAAEREKVQKLMSDPSIAAEVQKDLDQGMAAHVDRTPTMVMTRKGKVTPWISWSDYGLFKSMVDLLLSK